MSLNAEYWNQRYLDGNFPWDMGTPSPPLIEYLGQLEDKNQRILFPGAGLGHDAAWALENGFSEVYVIDWAPEALDRLQEQHPQFPVSNLICEDFFELNERFDLVMEQTFFCALDPEKRPHYAEKMGEVLVKGGKLAGVWFDFPQETGPPYGGSVSEYRSYFQDGWHVRTFDRCHNSIPPRAGKEVFGLIQKR